MNDVLRGKRCYLSGPIEFDNSEVDWRPPVKEHLTKFFGIDIYDPFCDPKQSKSDALQKAREAEDFDGMREVTKQFVRKDLHHVDLSHFLIANLPYKVPTVGTVHEIINSNDRKKPTLLVCTKGKKYIPSWYFGFIKHKYMFGSWNELYDYLSEVSEGKHFNDDRWWIVNELI